MSELSSTLPLTAFSESWWVAFLERTRRLTSPTVVNNCFDADKREFFEQSVMQVLRELCRLRTNEYGLRIYINGEQLPRKRLDHFYDNPPAPDESLAAWVSRVFPEQEFGIIINTGEKFVHELSQEIARMLAPLFASLGFPREGVNYTIFIGNYDKTPLGIHQDKRGENVMHFHLGPARKTMFLWDETTYRDLLKTYPRSDVASFKPHAVEYTFGPGDVFFMPEGTFHIGEQEGFSMGLTVWQYNHSDAYLLKNLHARIGQRIATTSEVVIASDQSNPESTAGLAQALQAHDVDSAFGDKSYAQLLREAYRDSRYALHSNGGYRGAPFFIAETPDMHESSVVRIVAPYRILVRVAEEENQLHVYVRGHRIEMRNFSCIHALVEKINEGGHCAVGQLLDVLDPAWDRSIGQYFLLELYKRRGIEFVGREDETEIAEDGRKIFQ
jgi:hypothetical protein